MNWTATAQRKHIETAARPADHTAQAGEIPAASKRSRSSPDKIDTIRRDHSSAEHSSPYAFARSRSEHCAAAPLLHLLARTGQKASTDSRGSAVRTGKRSAV